MRKDVLYESVKRFVKRILTHSLRHLYGCVNLKFHAVIAIMINGTVMKPETKQSLFHFAVLRVLKILQFYFKNRVLELSHSEFFTFSHRIRRCFQLREMQPLQLKNLICLTIQTVHGLVTANCINYKVVHFPFSHINYLYLACA